MSKGGRLGVLSILRQIYLSAPSCFASAMENRVGLEVGGRTQDPPSGLRIPTFELLSPSE